MILRDDVRVGHVGAGHADHVELAAGDGVAGGRHVLDLRRVEGREAGRGADLAGEVEVRGGAHALDRDDVGQAGVGVDVARTTLRKSTRPLSLRRREISSPSARVSPPDSSSSPV